MRERERKREREREREVKTVSTFNKYVVSIGNRRD